MVCIILEKMHRLVGIRRGDRVKARIRQNVGRERAYGRLVVDDQNASGQG
jgi:hypothetical protein